MKQEERTFVAVKPDGVKRGIIGRVVQRSFIMDNGGLVYICFIKILKYMAAV